MTIRDESDAPRSVTVTDSGPVAVGGDVKITGSVAAGRDVIIERLTVIADDGAPFGDAATRPGSGTDVCPYPGIQSFVAEQRTYFFGRDRDRRALLDLLDRASFVAVIGGSGSGKSSLLAAGVVPDFVEAASAQGQHWSVTTLRPGTRPASHLDELRRQTESGARVVVVVDQLEEVFARAVDPEERNQFLDALVEYAGRGIGATKVLVALRSDFYAHLDLHRPTADAVAAHQHRLLPLDEDALRDVILLPAERVGLRVEPALVEHVLDDVEPGANQLPLLAYAMRETWRRRRNGWLTLAGYMEAGGIAEALENGAQSVWQGLTTEQRATTKRIFLRLTSTGEGRPATRQRSTVEGLVTDIDDLDAVLDVLERFTRERLVVPDVDSAGHPTVDIAHEALLREWSVLRDWLDEDVETRRLQRELAHAAQMWSDAGGEPAGLLGGRRLQAVQDARRAGQVTLNETERAFVDASTGRASRDRRRSVLLSVLPVVLALAVGVVAVVTVQQRRTAHLKTVADSLQLAATARSLTSSQRDVAGLLAVAAFETDDNLTTLAALVDAVTVPEGPLAFMTLAGAQATALASAFQTDGPLVVGASDGSLRFLSPTGGGESDRIATELTSITAVAVAADGTVVAGGSNGGVAVVVPGRRDVIELAGPTTPIRAVAFDVATRTIVAATAQGGIWRWPLDPRAEPLDIVPVEGLRAMVLVEGGDGGPTGDPSQLVVATADGSLALVDPGGEIVATVDDVLSVQPGVAIASLPDRNLLLLDRSGLRRWELEANQPGAAPHATEGLTSMAITPDGSRAFVGTESGEVDTWTLDPPIRIGGSGAGLVGPVKAVATDGKTVVALDQTGHLVTWDGEGRRSPSTSERLDHDTGVVAIARGPDAVIASGGLDGVVWLTAADGAAEMLTDLGTPVRGLGWLGSGELVIGAQDGSVRAIDTIAGTTRDVAPASADPIVAVASSASGAVAFASSGGRITVLGGDRAVELRVAGAPVVSLALAPAGDVVAVGTGSPDNDVRLWDVAAAEEPRVLDGHTLKVTSVAFSPSGDLVASGSDDWDIRLWSVRSGELRGVLEGHKDLVQSLAFGADGTLLASGSEDFTIRVWDVARQRQLGEPWQWTDGPVQALSVAADGRSIAAAFGADFVEWAFGEDGWTDRACRLAGRELTVEEWERYAPSRRPITLCEGTSVP